MNFNFEKEENYGIIFLLLIVIEKVDYIIDNTFGKMLRECWIKTIIN